MLRSVIGAALVVALFVLLAVNFSMMWLNGGGYFLYEDNRFILVCETVMTALIGDRKASCRERVSSPV